MAIPAKCVTVEEARALQDNWKKTREPEINRAIGSIDTREFFYSVAELEEYLKSTNHLNTTITKIEPEIEDCFMQLMKSPSPKEIIQ